MRNKYLGIVYLVLAVFVIIFGTANFINGSGKTWQNILIVLIGLYFAYRGVATIHNAKVRKDQEDLGAGDGNDDPANA